MPAESHICRQRSPAMFANNYLEIAGRFMLSLLFPRFPSARRPDIKGASQIV